MRGIKPGEADEKARMIDQGTSPLLSFEMNSSISSDNFRVHFERFEVTTSELSEYEAERWQSQWPVAEFY